MAIMFDASSDDAVIDVLYERPRHVIDRQERRYREYQDNGGRRPTSRLQEATKELYTRVRSGRIYRGTLAATRRLRERGREDLIGCLDSIGEFQHSSRSMQDVIMSNPTFRSRYQAKRLEGFAGDWTERNEYRNSCKHSDPLYRVINNEVPIKEDDGTVWAYQYSMTRDERESMTIEERTDARQTWAAGNGLLWDSMEDPTSKFNALL